MKRKVHLQLVPLPEPGSSVPMHTRSGSCVQGREETVRGGGSLSLGWFSHVSILWWVLSLKNWGIQTIHALLTKDTVGSAPVQTLVSWGDVQGVCHKIWAALGLLAVLCPSAGAVLSSEQHKNCYLKPGEMPSQGPGFSFQTPPFLAELLLCSLRQGGEGWVFSVVCLISVLSMRCSSKWTN